MFFKNIFTLTTLSFLVYPLSLINQLLVSYHFGTSEYLDLYWLIMSYILLLVIHVQPLKEIFVNEYYNVNSNKCYRNKISNENLFFWLAFTIIGFLFIFIYEEKIYQIYLSDYFDLNKDILFILYKFLILYVIQLFVTEFFNGILISKNFVAYQGISKLITVLCSIVIIFIFVKDYGVISLAIGLNVGLFILLILQIKTLYKHNFFKFKLVFPRTSTIIFKKVIILILFSLFTQLYLIYERFVFMNLKPGLISAYQYSRSLHDIPYYIFIVTFQISIWPVYLKENISNDKVYLYEVTKKKLKYLILILTLISLLFWFNSPYIIYLVYFRGVFDIESLLQTAISFKAIAFALVPTGILTILSKALFVLDQSKKIAYSGLIGAMFGATTLYIAFIHQSLNIAIHHFLICQLSISLFIGIYFLIYTNTFNFKYLLKIFYWLFRLATVVIIFLYLYPVNEFTLNDFQSILYDLVLNSIIISLIILISYISIGLIHLYDFKKIFYLLRNKLIIYEKNHS